MGEGGLETGSRVLAYHLASSKMRTLKRKKKTHKGKNAQEGKKNIKRKKKLTSMLFANAVCQPARGFFCALLAVFRELLGLFDPRAWQSANGGSLFVHACKGFYTVIC